MTGDSSSATRDDAGAGVVICMPVFNDWESAENVIQQIDQIAGQLDSPVTIVLVDDGSTQPAPARLADPPSAIGQIILLQLRRNVGHQRAIALGLAFVHACCPCRYVVVMDGDGEDSPEDIPRLLECCRSNNDNAIVFAQRSKRSEGPLFRIGYAFYKILHRLLTGRRQDIGNFSVVPAELLNRLVGVSEIWNHYSAAVVHARLPVEKVPTPRGERLSGKSKMNVTSLVTHGLSAISVDGDTVGVRILGVLIVFIALLVGGLATAVYTRLFTDLAIPGWATNIVGLLAILLVNLLLIAIVFVLTILQARNYASFLPIRDWEHYVANRSLLHG